MFSLFGQAVLLLVAVGLSGMVISRRSSLQQKGAKPDADFTRAFPGSGLRCLTSFFIEKAQVSVKLFVLL